MQRTEIIIPSSTSNLGASFDAVGLALALYLRVTVEEPAEQFVINPTGEGEAAVERGEENLIARVARYVARCRGREISGARLTVDSEIPLARGLGSSSSAIMPAPGGPHEQWPETPPTRPWRRLGRRCRV